MQTPSFKEDHISQLPALLLLQNTGYEYISPEDALDERHSKLSSVLLEEILEQKIRELNKITFRSKTHQFSDANIRNAILALKEIPFDGLVRTNEKIYDLLCLGKAFEQTIDGNTKSYPIKYIDWENIENNVFHVSDEFEVERKGMNDTYRPDLVLFVNGIPLAVIECKTPDIKDSLDQAISQQIRNQKEDGIVDLFVFSQILLGVNKNEAKYATTGTGEKYWAHWKEQFDTDKEIEGTVNKILPESKKDKLFKGKYRYLRSYFEESEKQGGRMITGQDRAIYSLLRPERLLEFSFQYLVFDAGVKKIARYQQYFAVKRIHKRISEIGVDGKRPGGIVWHTQGSGKSLAMVMLGKTISLDKNIKDPRIVLVSDRLDLDEQIWKTFHRCGKDPEKATTGTHLVELIKDNKQIITSVIHKFDSAVKSRKYADSSPNIFVLVDESHRTQYGSFHTMMHKVFPNACFLGFTGTPIMKKNKNTVAKFGGLIDKYTIDQAVADKAVVPLLYEGRHVEQMVNKTPIDTWFDRVAEPLTEYQKVDLKKKFSHADQLNRSEQRLRSIAWDVSEHYANHWKGTGLKAQLTADLKSSAIKIKKYLDEIGKVTSEIVISAPDMREGHFDIDEESNSDVQAFWKKMMNRYGSEKKYVESTINQFLNDEDPEIIIVVDKLLTGFDAPRNTVLYIVKNLGGHNLLQAIARVNRLYPGKDFGYIIDYYGLLGELDKTLTMYTSFAEFDEQDIFGCLAPVEEEVKKLSQRYSDLWDIFKVIFNKYDEEAYERLLGDDALREKFYVRLCEYAKNLDLALSTIKFINETPEKTVFKYKEDLKFFSKLRISVRKRYAESIDYKEYETKIQKLLDTHIVSDKVERIIPLVNIFDKDAFEQELAKIEGAAARADVIAHRTKKTIHEKMGEDPAFYKKFSKMLEEVIEEFRQKRISELQYLKNVQNIMESVRNKSADGMPEALREKEHARAFYGAVKEILKSLDIPETDKDALAVDTGLKIDEIIENNIVVDWHVKKDIQNRMINEIEDYLYHLKDNRGIDLDFDRINEILEDSMQIAKSRFKK